MFSRSAPILALAFCLLPTPPSASFQGNSTIARSSFGGRVVEVVAEGAGDRRIDMRQEGGRFQIEVDGHRITITDDGTIRVDGVERTAIASRVIRIVVHDDLVDLRAGD